jgi:hypothetical protein
MPERNLDLYRDLKRVIYARRKNTIVKNHAVLDADAEDLGQSILGRIVYAGTSKAQMLLFEIEYQQSVPPPRTRLVVLRAPMAVGTRVTGNDLAVQDAQP